MTIPELTLTLFGSTLAGSVILMFVMQKVKVWLHLTSFVITIVTFVVGGVLGALGFLFHLVPPASTTLIYCIIQGLVSAWVATGGYDFIKSMIEKAKLPPA